MQDWKTGGSWCTQEVLQHGRWLAASSTHHLLPGIQQASSGAEICHCPRLFETSAGAFSTWPSPRLTACC